MSTVDAEYEYITWSEKGEINSWQYICGYCGITVASTIGFKGEYFWVIERSLVDNYDVFVYFCPNCSRPTFFDYNKQVPGVKYGKPINYIAADWGSKRVA